MLQRACTLLMKCSLPGVHCNTAVRLTAYASCAGKWGKLTPVSLLQGLAEPVTKFARESRSQRGRSGRQSKAGRGFSHGGSVAAAEPPFKDPAEVKVAFAGE